MAYHAYTIGRIKRQDDGSYLLVSVGIYSDGPMSITSVGDRYVELVPPVEGKSYGEAHDTAVKYWDCPKYGHGKLMYRGLKREWAEESP